MAAAAALPLAGCGGGGEGTGAGVAGPPGDPVALAGATDQGLRIRLDPVEGRAVEVTVAVRCDLRGTDGHSRAGMVPFDDRGLRAPVGDDGTFEIDDRFVVEGNDGNETHVEVRIGGAFARDASAAGTLDARFRQYNGQLEDFDLECASGSVGWAAAEPPTGGAHAVVPLAGVVGIEAVGDDLLALHGDSPPGGQMTLVDGRAVRAGRPVSLELSEAGEEGAVGHVEDLVVTGDGVWLADGSTETLVRAGVATGPAAAVPAVDVVDLVGGHGALWTLSWADEDRVVLARRDHATGEVTATAPDAYDVGVLAAGQAGLWFVDDSPSGPTAERHEVPVRHVDPDTLEVTTEHEVELPGGLSAATSRPVVASETGGERLWLLAQGPAVATLGATGEVTTVELPSPASDVAVAGAGVWTTHPDESVIRRIEGGEVTRTLDVPGGMDLVAVVGDGTVWLAGRQEGTVVRLDPAVTG